MSAGAPRVTESLEPGRDGLRRLDATVVGRVQGVGFRYWVLERARALRLSGWVANQQDGSVRCVVEGPEPLLRRLLTNLAEGPAMSRVDSVAELWSAPTGEFSGFRIRSLGHGGD